MDDNDLRVHHRALMEASGLQNIIGLARKFGVDSVDTQLDILQDRLDDIERKLKERMDEEILRDLTNPEDVYNAIKLKTKDSKAQDYFLSMLQHLLLVREEGQGLTHYFQLIDSLVADLVMDKKLGGGEQRLGLSVDRIIGQFNEAARNQYAEEELSKAHATILQLRLDKESVEEQLGRADGGLVGELKSNITRLEEKLQVSRENTTKLQGQMESQKVGYEEQIAQLEAQIMELFRMLKEVNKGVDRIIEGSSGMDRKTLIETLERHMQRDKTISILEGRSEKLKKQKANGQIDGEDSDGTADENDTPTKSGSLRRRQASTRNHGKGGKGPVSRVSEAPNGRSSQFMDADEEMAEEQIQQQLAQGVKIVGACEELPRTITYVNLLCSTLLAMVHHSAPGVFVVRLVRSCLGRS